MLPLCVGWLALPALANKTLHPITAPALTNKTLHPITGKTLVGAPNDRTCDDQHKSSVSCGSNWYVHDMGERGCGFIGCCECWECCEC